MRRTVCLLMALAAFDSAAQAQSSVTLYGVADANLEYVSNMSAQVPAAANGFKAGPGHSAYRVSSGGLSGSRWGLRGAEDLGAGLKALFVLESGFNIDDGKQGQGGRMFGRQAYIGIESARVGSFTFGRQYTTLAEVLANFAPAAFATQYDPIFLQLGLNYRSDNVARYTGTFGPVKAVAHWSFGNGVSGSGEVPGQFRRDTGYGAGLVYASGAFAATVGYDQYNPTLDAAGSTGTFKKVAIAASYGLGPATIMSGYRWGQSKGVDGSLVLRDDYYWVGAVYHAAPSLDFNLGYYYDNAKNVAGATNLKNPWQIQFIGTYSLTRRSSLYLTTAYAKNAALNLDSLADSFVGGHVLGAGKDSMLGVGVGIRHIF